MANMLPLARHAGRLRTVARAGALVLPMLALAAGFLPSRYVNVGDPVLPHAWAAAVAFVVSLVLAAALLRLARMLAEVGQGRAFAPEATRHFRGFARLVLAAVLIEIFLPLPVQAGLVLFAGGRTLMLGIDSSQFLLLLTGLVLFLVARLFDEAARLEEDSRSIV